MSEAIGLSEAVYAALREGPFAMRGLAAESGLSYDVLRSWRSGRRKPHDASAARLAAGLRLRSHRLAELAAAIEAELRSAAQG